MTLFKLLFTAFLFTTSLFYSPDRQPTKCEQVYQQAKKDQDQEQLKYYYFGIAQLAPSTVGKLQLLYQIEVISLGCMVNEEQICYNQYVNIVLKAKTGKDFYGLVESLE